MIYLKKIEMYGFKSFADKVEIRFDQPITAIVGPNGCGKSNVSDSIRWVLGEQNTKFLRGKNMQDLIFNGTDKRKSMSYCEVSLFMDNTTRIFPIQMDEIIISRKLYRNNESEYLLNRNVVRLKDILELLRSVGLGKEGFSIVGQGRMDAILNAKPDDRRAIFESALGISNFRVKKGETERKLERTKQNMSTLTNILSELERQLGPLRKQTVVARQYLDLRDKLRYHEINSYIYSYDNANQEKQDARAKLAGLQEEFAQKNTEYTEVSQLYDKLVEDINSMEQNLAELREKRLKLSVELEKQAGDKNLVNERIKNCRQEILSTDSRIYDINTQIDKLKENISNNETSLAKKQEELQSIESELLALAEKYNAINSKANNSLTEGEQLQYKLNQTLHDIAEFNAKQSSFATETQSLTDRYNVIDEQLTKLKDKMNNLSDEEKQLIERFENNNNLKVAVAEQIQTLKQEIKQKEYDLFNSGKQLTAKQQIVAGEKGSIDLLKDFADNYKAYQLSVQNLMQDAKKNPQLASRICGVVGSLIKVEPEYQVAIETALGARVQNIVTENEEDATYLIRYLKQNMYGRVTFLPISSMKPRTIERRQVLQEQGVCGIARDIVRFDPKYNSIFDSILGSILIVDNIDNAVAISKKYGYVHRMVTLAGERVNNDGSLEGGSSKKNNTSVLSYEVQIEQRMAKLHELENNLQQAENSHSQLQAVVNDMRDKLGKLEEQAQQLNVDIATDKEKIETSNTLNNTDKQNIIGLQAEQENINQRLKSIKEESELTAEKLANLHEEEKKLNIRIASNKSFTQTNSASKDALQDTLSSKRYRVGVLRSNIEASMRELNDDRAELQRNEDYLQATQKYREQMQNAMDTLCQQLDLSDTTNGTQAELAQIMQKLQTADSTKVQLNEQFQQASDKRMQLATDTENVRSAIERQEYIIVHIDEDLQELQERVLQEYDMTYSGAMQYKDENYDYANSKQTINDLRTQIQSLGNVNVGAIEQIKEVEERYGDIGSQVADLEQAEADLVNILDDLTNEMETRFEDGMNKINDNFKVVFRELFNGGNAKLSLDKDPTKNSLDYGVEIEAQPPGKKLQNISLLSGGERTLTAAAILFAILKLNPMPFCVLDEIEAALDDSNADRIARYLRSFADDTQFIVITHKKPTMENSDVLYGVTMEEKGVSKIVSVKLNEAIKQAQ